MNAAIDVTGVEIETPRLLLRAWKQEDLADFYEYARVDGVGQMAGWMPHKSMDESKAILEKFIEHKKTFAIVSKADGKTIGSVGVELYHMEEELSEFFDYKGREIGFVLSKAYWGQGLMTEAVKAVVAYCFDQLNYDFLLCGRFNSNTRSMRVQQKVGFVPYRKMTYDTKIGTKEQGILNLLVNPKKTMKFNFSHPETLIYANQ